MAPLASPSYTSEPAAFTDDTQMTLFTAEGLLSEGDPLLNIHQAYLRWRLTQQSGINHYPTSKIEGIAACWGCQSMHRRRGARAHLSERAGHPYRPGQPAVNTSKGCGGIMRVAPIGLWAPHIGDDRTVFELAMKAARLTHGHASGHLSAGYFAVMIAALLRGETVREALAAAGTVLKLWRGADEVWMAIDAAIELADEGAPSPERLADLGGGWTGEEALAIAVCCAMTASSFSDGVLRAVNHSGDCDLHRRHYRQPAGRPIWCQRHPAKLARPARTA